MVNLVMKDATIQKKSFIMATLYSIGIFIAFGLKGGDFAIAVYIMGTVATTCIFIQNGFANDEKNNSEKILNSLPITRREIVIAKYISSIGFSVFTIILMFITGTALSKIFIGKIPTIYSSDIIIALLSVWLLIALYLPFNFKFGYSRMRVYNTLVFLAFFFAPKVILSEFLSNPTHPIVKLINESSTEILSLISLAVVVVILLLSMFSSLKLYEKREF